ncbi:MAG: hypothetical protein MJB14_05295, partial [Spirochaetes bacterium]|nr:hypothetical protein [Spirochaetota bacterium]
MHFVDKRSNLPLSFVYGKTEGHSFNTGFNDTIDKNDLVKEYYYAIFRNGYSPVKRRRTNNVIKMEKLYSLLFDSSGTCCPLSNPSILWKLTAVDLGKYESTSGDIIKNENLSFSDRVEKRWYSSSEFEYYKHNVLERSGYYQTVYQDSGYYSGTYRIDQFSNDLFNYEVPSTPETQPQ